MLRQIDTLVDAGASFMFRNTLASVDLCSENSLAVWRPNCQGYRTAVNLSSATQCRILNRTRTTGASHRGGHNIPEGVIRQRFAKSSDYFEKYYKSIVDEWYGLGTAWRGEFRRAESWKDLMGTVLDIQEVQQQTRQSRSRRKTWPCQYSRRPFRAWGRYGGNNRHWDLSMSVAGTIKNGTAQMSAKFREMGEAGLCGGGKGEGE